MNEPLTVFYDGLCPLCAREIAYYRRRAPADAVRFADIAAADFDAARHGLDPVRVHVMHARRGETLYTGVEAFIALWDALPGFRHWAWLARQPGVHGLLRAGYRAFAAARPWLPRRKCTSGACFRQTRSPEARG